MPGKAAKVTGTEKQHAILLKFANAKSSTVSLAQPSRIILSAIEGHNNEAIEKDVGLQHDAVGTWRRRWRDNWQPSYRYRMCRETACPRIRNQGAAFRSTTVRTHSQNLARAAGSNFQKACEAPKASNRPIASWTHRDLSLQLKPEGLSDSMSGRWVGNLIRQAAIRPHKNNWLTSKDKADPNFEQRVADICGAYRDAITLYQTRGIDSICIDEQTGIHALRERCTGSPCGPGANDASRI